jgi:hypothetical protein
VTEPEINAASARIQAAWGALKDAMKHLDETADDGVAERVRLAAIECWNLYQIVVATEPTS